MADEGDCVAFWIGLVAVWGRSCTESESPSTYQGLVDQAGFLDRYFIGFSVDALAIAICPNSDGANQYHRQTIRLVTGDVTDHYSDNQLSGRTRPAPANHEL